MFTMLFYLYLTAGYHIIMIIAYPERKSNHETVNISN